MSLRALREGWPPGPLARRLPRRDRPGEFGVVSAAASGIRTRALDRLVRAVLAGEPPAGLPPDLWPPEAVRELVRAASEGTAGYRPRREFVRRWLEDPTGRWQGPRTRRQGVRRGSLHAVRDPRELEGREVGGRQLTREWVRHER